MTSPSSFSNFLPNQEIMQKHRRKFRGGKCRSNGSFVLGSLYAAWQCSCLFGMNGGGASQCKGTRRFLQGRTQTAKGARKFGQMFLYPSVCHFDCVSYSFQHVCQNHRTLTAKRVDLQLLARPIDAVPRLVLVQMEFSGRERQDDCPIRRTC